MKKALVVGIDYYQHTEDLNGCVNDAHDIESILERHGDGTKNFDVQLLCGTSDIAAVSKKDLKSAVIALFAENNEIALFYFAGHGYIESTGGYLLTSDACEGDEGLSMDDILQLANDSPAKNKIIILDCCHSGRMGDVNFKKNHALLSEGITILTASSKTQYAQEVGGSGVFTRLLVDALSGSAANLTGDVTPGSVYAHIDQSLGSWEQRPIFKTNVTSFTTLRKVQPPISLEDLRKLNVLFQVKGENFPLDPEYEPESGCARQGKVEKFKILQKFNRVNLVVPDGAEHMYGAAMESKSCKMTILGEHYWNLLDKKRI